MFTPSHPAARLASDGRATPGIGRGYWLIRFQVDGLVEARTWCVPKRSMGASRAIRFSSRKMRGHFERRLEESGAMRAICRPRRDGTAEMSLCAGCETENLGRKR